MSKTTLIVALGFVVLLVAAAGMALLGGWEGDGLASNAPPALSSAESRAAAPPAATTSRPQEAPLARAEAVSDDDPFGALKLDGGSFELVGRVVGQDGKPIAKATAQLFIANFPMLAPPAVELMRSNGMRVEELLKKTGPDGIFKLRSTFTDGNDYLLLVKAPNAAPVARRGMNIERGAVADVGDIVMEAGYQVSGRVLDPSNNPVLAARVVAVPTPNWTSVERFLENAEPQDFMATDDHGEFTIPNLADGRYTIVAWAKGLARGAAPPVVITKEKPPSPIEVHLAPGAGISGTVVNASGAGVADAKVRLRFQRTDNPDAGGFVTFGEDSILCDYPVIVTTDNTGRFDADGLVSEKQYRLSASADGYRRSDDNLVARAGQNGVSIHLKPNFEIHGKVVDGETGNPIVGAQIGRYGGRVDDLRSGPGAFPKIEGSSDSQGKFLARDGERPGRTTLLAWFPNNGNTNHPGYAPAMSEAFEMTDAKEIPEITIKMEKGACLAGAVTSGATGEPLAGASVNLFATRDPKVPNYRPYGTGQFIARASSDGAGSFHFDGLLPGSYCVEVRHAVLGGTRCEVVQIAKGERREGLRISVPIPGTIRGTVLTHGVFGGIRVTATRADGLAFVVFADVENRFVFSKLPPGLYRVRAEKLTSYDELFMGGRGSGMADGSVTLDLRDGQTQEIALEMPDSNLGRLVGTIVDEAGAGSGYMLILVRESSNQGAALANQNGNPTFGNFRSVTADVDGAFEFPAVREGTYRIYAIPRGRSIMPKNSVASESIQIFGNATARRDLFGRSGPIRGKVQRPNGQPFANCNVVAIVNGSRGPSSALPAGTRFTARTRGDGSFDFGRLPGGAYDVVIENTQYPKKIVGVEVYGSNSESLAITMDQQGRPSGKFNVNSK